MTAVYAVGSRADLARVVARAVVTAGVLGALAALLGRHTWSALVLVVFGVLVWLPSLRVARTRLAVHAEGIALSFPISWRRASTTRSWACFERRFMTWPVVHRVEIYPARDLVRIVLTSDAPLPPWLRGRIVDPDDPESGPVVERRVPGVDAAALHRAVLVASPRTPVSTG